MRTPPTIRRTGSFLYLRLRRHDYNAEEVEAWAARLEPFLAPATTSTCSSATTRSGAGRRARPRASGRARIDGRLRAASARALGRPPMSTRCVTRRAKHEVPLLDVVEPVRDAVADEDDRARPDRPLLVAHADLAAAGDDVVDLVLGVRLLRVRSRRPAGRTGPTDRSGVRMNSR